MLNQVQLSMRSGNTDGCSHAIVEKGGCAALILLRDAECAVFPLRQPEASYLLLKHYPDGKTALQDFYKLIGKMCAKPVSSKYFLCPVHEDNRMVVLPDGTEHMITPEEAALYAARFTGFLGFADNIRRSLAGKRSRITVRPLTAADIPIIVAEEEAQGWHPTAEKYEMRLRDQEAGRCHALTAELDGRIAGYINLYHTPLDGPFIGSGMPEIVDFGVLVKYRQRGVGTALMDAAEALAAKEADAVCLGVGLHSGYGASQRMYVKRGYIPDGSGVWYRGDICQEYSSCCNDDDLVLFLSKSLH